eukprot:8337653-Pyramimonas_sp.AAC.1
MLGPTLATQVASSDRTCARASRGARTELGRRENSEACLAYSSARSFPALRKAETRRLSTAARVACPLTLTRSKPPTPP